VFGSGSSKSDELAMSELLLLLPAKREHLDLHKDKYITLYIWLKLYCEDKYITLYIWLKLYCETMFSFVKHINYFTIEQNIE